MHYDFLGPRGLQGTQMDTLKHKHFKTDDIHCERGFLYILGDPGPSVAPFTYFRMRPTTYLLLQFIDSTDAYCKKVSDRQRLFFSAQNVEYRVNTKV